MSTTIRVGDSLSVLRSLPSGSVHCCVTSPPYFGLRDYGIDGQIGAEPSPAAYAAALVDVFREVRRVLRDDGTCWLNLGDSWAAQRGGTHMPAQTIAGGQHGKGDEAAWRGMGGATAAPAHRNASKIGLKHKDMIGIPWLVAFALREDGWYLRQDIVWQKPNPQPESVRDRCTKAHEYIFLLAKSERYFFDAAAIQEPVVAGTGEKRNARSVWTINTKPLKDAHFATFPMELPTRCIRAGTSSDGCCSVCGAPRAGAGACDCAAPPAPCVVLDPFGGAGTTAVAAQALGRNSIYIDINPEYVMLAMKRLASL